MTAALLVSHVSKSFPGVRALDDVSLTLSAGSIHALLGENGAGKSTLIKIITGIHKPDRGEIRVNGEVVHLANPRQAGAEGIGVVHQERNLVARFSIAENIMLERLGRHDLSTVNYEHIHAEASKWLKLLDLDVDCRTPVSRLSVAQMQLVEIGCGKLVAVLHYQMKVVYTLLQGKLILCADVAPQRAANNVCVFVCDALVANQKNIASKIF